jgi:hypothetical protein
MKLPNRRYPTGKSTLRVVDAQNDREEVARVVNGNLAFGSPSSGTQNITGFWFQGTTPPSAGTQFVVNHGLGYVPTGWLLFSISAPARLYRGSSTWTQTQAFLICDTASVAMTVFIT